MNDYGGVVHSNIREGYIVNIKGVGGYALKHKGGYIATTEG